MHRFFKGIGWILIICFLLTGCSSQNTSSSKKNVKNNTQTSATAKDEDSTSSNLTTNAPNGTTQPSAVPAQTTNTAIPLDGNFVLAFYPDLPTGQMHSFSAVFTKKVEGVTIVCVNSANNDSSTFYDQETVEANTPIEIDAKHGWNWLPGDTLTIKANGYDTITYHLPDRYNTPEWDQFLNQVTYNTLLKCNKLGKPYSYMDPSGIYHSVNPQFFQPTDIYHPEQTPLPSASAYTTPNASYGSANAGTEDKAFLRQQLDVVKENKASEEKLLADCNLETLKPTLIRQIAESEQLIEQIEAKLAR